MKANKATIILINIVLLHLPPMLRAAELEEIVLYHAYTADPTAVDLTFTTAGTISAIRIRANKTTDAKSIQSVSIDFGSLGAASLPAKMVSCIPEPSLKDLSFRITNRPITKETFGSWTSTLVITFASYHTDYSDMGGSFIEPTISYEFSGSQLEEITVRNGKGDFIDVDGPIKACPTKEIEWALIDKS